MFTHEDVKILDESQVYSGHFKVLKYCLQHRLFVGGWSRAFERELVVKKPAVGVLPYDPSLNQLVLIEQFRIGALQDRASPWLIEIVAGIVEKNEELEEVAYRETYEEAGLEIINLLPIAEYWTSAGGTNEKISLYCAHVDAQQAGGYFGLAEENEYLRAFTLTPEEAFLAVASGKINNAAAIIALQWLQINLSIVRKTWLENKVS